MSEIPSIAFQSFLAAEAILFGVFSLLYSVFVLHILAQDLGYVFGHCLVAGKTGNSVEEKRHMGRVT